MAHKTRHGAALLGAAVAALAAGAVTTTPATAPRAATVAAAQATSRGDAAPPTQAVRAPSAERAILPALPYMDRSARRWPIWVGRLRDSGYRPRPV